METSEKNTPPVAQQGSAAGSPFVPLVEDPSFYLPQQPQPFPTSGTITPSGVQTGQPILQLTPSQAEEVLAGLGLSALITNPYGSPEAALAVGSPLYQGSAEGIASGVVGGQGPIPAFARRPSTGAAGGVAVGVSRVLSMDVDHPFPIPSLASSSASTSSPTTTPSTAPRSSYSFYPPGAPVGVQRHHPYAHPTHVRPTSTLAHTQSSPALPMYFSSAPTPASAPPSIVPTPLDSPHVITPSMSHPGSALSSPHPLSFSPAPALVHRAHSAAPGPPLTLSTKTAQQRQDELQLVFGSEGGPNDPRRFAEMTGVEGPGYGGSSGADWEMPSGLTMPAGSMSVPLDSATGWDGSTEGQGSKQDDQVPQPGYFDGVSSPYPYINPHVYAVTPDPIPQIPVQLDSPVPAIALVRNRLPILEAALSATAADPGEDEEEIWKAVEGAYEELKRVMLGRRDARRGGASLHSSKRSFAAMDLESPSTPAERDRALAASKFLSQQIHPPLLHSQSTPDAPHSAEVNVARAQAQVQASQVQLQQAQLEQAQVQAQAHQAHLQAEADARARVEAESRARHEEEARAKQLELEREREAEALARHHEQQQQEQYQLALQLQQDQHLRLAHQQQQQQQIAQAQADAEAHAQQQIQQHHAQMQQLALDAQIQHQQHQHHQLQLQAQAQAQAQAQQAQAQAQAQAQFNPLAQYPPPSAQYTLPPNPNVPPPLHSHHSSHAPSPLSVVTPNNMPLDHASQHSSPVSRPNLSYPVPNGIPPPTSMPLVPLQGFAPPYDVSMGSVMQMQIGTIPFASPSDPMSTQSIDPRVQPQPAEDWNATTGASTTDPDVTPRVAAAQVPPPSTTRSATPQPMASPPHSAPLSVHSSRPSRSRAASASGYVSASGSRSRAESGSGYQSTFDTRSRAASSASSAFGMYERDEEDDDEHDADEAPQKAMTQMGAASAGVEPALRGLMDPVFLEFLAELCSDLDATDSKGEPIHQTLMAKKMERLDQSHDFRPFKFRIQAFTMAFSEMLADKGFKESDVPVKKIRQYLWAQPCIARFNDDGKKAKSKGNHIWTIEAKKVPDKKWLFREFTRCIKGAAPPIAFIGSTWTWSPRVWDPQCSVAAINATFSSPALPSWLSWEDNVLSGDVPESLKGTKFELTGVATFQVGGKAHQLEQLVKVSITSVGDHEEQTYRDLTMEENKPSKSADSSSVGSPPPSHSGTPFRSPTIASNGLLGEASPPPSSLLPSLMGNANYQTGSLILPTQHMQIDGAPSNESDLLRQIQNQQLVQHQQYLAQAMYHAQMTESQIPVDPSQLPRQQSYLGQPFESQAELHQRYAAALNSPFDPAGVPANLSYTPPPELVAVALQQAYERSLNPAYSNAFELSLGSQSLPPPPSSVGQAPPPQFLDSNLSLAQSQYTGTVDPSNL